jgi:hypothetical protein
MILALLLKLALAPALVGAATRVARELGHRAGGVVGGLPVVAAPILLIYAVDHGDGYAAAAARATVLGIVSLVGFCIAYGLVAGHAGVGLSLLAGWVAFGAGTLFFDIVHLPLGPSAALAAASVAGAAWWFSRQDTSAAARASNDLMVWRLLATAAMVVALTSAAGSLSPWLAGLLAPFPIITAVLAGFTHAQAGGRAAIQLLGGLVGGLASFVLFFLVVALTLSPLGIAAAFALATLLALSSHAALVAGLRRDGVVRCAAA